jgi:predicted RNA-binding Zn-ribbon protein involved in translation (DUF1610 family)
MTISEIASESKKSYTTVRYHLKKYKIKPCGSKRSWSDEDLKKALSESFTVSDIIRKLGLSVSPGNFSTVNNRIKLLNLDSRHLKGKSCGLGKKISFEKDVLVENFNGSRRSVKKLILREKLIPFVCSECGLGSIWRGKKLVLRLDHKNGVSNDYRIENLRFLCPNCDSQQETFCSRNRKKRKKDA